MPHVPRTQPTPRVQVKSGLVRQRKWTTAIEGSRDVVEWAAYSTSFLLTGARHSNTPPRPHASCRSRPCPGPCLPQPGCRDAGGAAAEGQPSALQPWPRNLLAVARSHTHRSPTHRTPGSSSCAW